MSSHSLPASASRCPVVDGAAFDPLGAQECRDPMPWLRAAQRSAPVFFMPRYNMWCVTRYEDVIAVLRDPFTYSSRKTINLDKRPPDLLSAFPDGPPDRVLVSLDPPDHTRLLEAGDAGGEAVGLTSTEVPLIRCVTCCGGR